jgi:hypothetical protein
MSEISEFMSDAIVSKMLLRFGGDTKAMANALKRKAEKVAVFDPTPFAGEEDAAKSFWNGMPNGPKSLIFGLLNPLEKLYLKLVCREWNASFSALETRKNTLYISSNELSREDGGTQSFMTVLNCTGFIIDQTGKPAVMTSDKSTVKLIIGDKDGTIRVHKVVYGSHIDELYIERQALSGKVVDIRVGDLLLGFQNAKKRRQKGVPFSAAIGIEFNVANDEESRQYVTIPLKILGRTQIFNLRGKHSSKEDCDETKCGKCGEPYPIEYHGHKRAKFCAQCGDKRDKPKRNTVYIPRLKKIRN